MRIDQAGLVPGLPGRARKDGKSDGSEVTLTDLTPGGTTRFEILWIDPADLTAIVSLGPTSNSHVWKFTPTPLVRGGIRIRLTHTTPGGVTTTQVRIFGIADANGIVKPVPGERSSPNATIANATDPAIIDACERNWPTVAYPAGNPFGWGLDMNAQLESALTLQSLIEDSNSAIEEILENAPAQASALTTLQSQLATLQSTVSASAAAQTSLDALQQVAIDAQAAVNTAQAAAIAAEHSANVSQQTAIDLAGTVNAVQAGAIAAVQDLNALQQADIVSLESSVTDLRASVTNAVDWATASGGKFSVERFTEGESLSNANLPNALDAAIAAARAAINGNTTAACVPNVYVPPGRYTLPPNRKFVWHGNGYLPAPGFVCAGAETTTFLAQGVGGDAVFEFGQTGTDIMGTAYRQKVSGFSLEPANGPYTALRTGLRFFGALQPQISDLYIRDLIHSDALWDQCRGIEFGDTIHLGEHVNQQHVNIDKVLIFGCLTGAYLGVLGPARASQFGCAGNPFANAILAGVDIEWQGGDVQWSMGGDPTNWWSNRDMPGIVSDVRIVTASGTGATCGAASGRLSTVTGLSGLDQAIDRGRWLELIAEGTSANEKTVRGLYKIHSVPNPTTAIIRKGTSHTAQGGLSWRVRAGHGDNRVKLSGLYDESSQGRVAMFGFYRDANGSTYCMTNCTAAGLPLFEADGTGDITALSNVAGGSGNSGRYGRVRRVRSLHTDATFRRIQTDEASYAGLVCRSDFQASDVTVGHHSTTQFGVRDSLGGRAIRVRGLSRELGAVEIWDPRMPHTLTVVSTNVQEWRGALQESVLAPMYAEGYSQYIALDAGLQAPAIATVDPAPGNPVGVLAGSIAAAHLPNVPYVTTTFAVYRLPSGVGVTDRQRRIIVRTDDCASQLLINEPSILPSAAIGVIWSAGYGSALAAVNVAGDTAGHAAALFRDPNMSARVLTDYQVQVATRADPLPDYATHTVGQPLTVQVGAEPGNQTGAMHLAYLAVFPRGLSVNEIQQLINAARNEWTLTP